MYRTTSLPRSRLRHFGQDNGKIVADTRRFQARLDNAEKRCIFACQLRVMPSTKTPPDREGSGARTRSGRWVSLRQSDFRPAKKQAFKEVIHHVRVGGDVEEGLDWPGWSPSATWRVTAGAASGW